MKVSLKDRENSGAKLRLSRMIEPVKTIQKSDRKPLSQFCSDQNQAVAEEHHDTKFSSRVDCNSTVKLRIPQPNYDQIIIECPPRPCELTRELEHTKALAKIEEHNASKKIVVLSEKVQQLQQELTVTQTQTRRFQERYDMANHDIYELERRMVEREMQVSGEYEKRVRDLEVELQGKNKLISELTTDNSKIKYDMSFEYSLLNQQTERLKQQLAEKDYKLIDLQNKSTIRLAQIEHQLHQTNCKLSQAYCRLDQTQRELSNPEKQREMAANYNNLCKELQIKQDLIANLKHHLQRLCNVQSQNQQLKRNQKKLVRKYQLLQAQMSERNEKVNEIVLGYEAELESLKNQLGHTSQRANSLQEQLNCCRQKVKYDTAKDSSYVYLQQRVQASTQQINFYMGEVARTKQVHFSEMRMKQQKIATLTRQLVERQAQISRLVHFRGEDQAHTQAYSGRVSHLESQIEHLNQQLSKRTLLQHNQRVQQQKRAEQLLNANKMIECQLTTIQQLSRALQQTELALREKTTELSQVTMFQRKTQQQLRQFRSINRHQQEFRRQYKIEGSISVTQQLKLKITQLQATKQIVSELDHTNRILRQTNSKHNNQMQRMSRQVEQMLKEKALNQQLIVRIEQQSRAQIQKVRLELTASYQLLYEKYIKYRRILQKEKQRKEQQREIIKDSNKFNQIIVERCRDIIR